MATTTERHTVSTNTYTSSVFQEAVKPIFLHIVYTSDATVGNRQISFEVIDSADALIVDMHAGAVQAASNVYHYEYMSGIYRETSFVDNSIQVPFPTDMEIPPNCRFKVYDETNVSASDSMVINIQYKSADRY